MAWIMKYPPPSRTMGTPTSKRIGMTNLLRFVLAG
jgi:hypothetical protein